MRKKFGFYVPRHDNVGIDNLIPELWAQEALVMLEENMVAANMVYRDYDSQIASFGDVVNAHRPSTFNAKRKGVNDDVTVQNAEVIGIPVTLNQHLHTSFLIRDAEMSKSFKDLAAYFLAPAMSSIAAGVDKVVLGFIPQFLANGIGALDGLTDANAIAQILAARKLLNDNKVPLLGRKMLTTTATEATLLGLAQFISAEKVGDEGTALREASLGRKLGSDFYMGQNTPYVQTALAETVVGAINLGAGYAAGSTILTVDGFVGDVVPVGAYVTIVGSMFPHVVTARTAAPNTTSITVTPGLKGAVIDDAVVTAYTPIAIDLPASSYAAGYVKVIHVDGYTVVPQVGQIVRTAAGDVYTIMEIENDTGTECDILLNRPLVGALADGAVLGVGPGGSYNFNFVRDALALVTRPLALPKAPVSASVASYNDLSVRVVMTYDGNKQGHLITIDLLCGAAVLDVRQGAVLLG